MQLDGRKEEADMCKALKDMKKHEMKKGIKAGRKQGRKQGVKQGERLGTLKTLCTLINDGLLKADEAVRRASCRKRPLT